MPLKTLLYCCLAAGAASAQVADPVGQAFNVDVGLGPVCRAQCGGDQVQPGHWNHFGAQDGDRLPLLDVQGRKTSVVLQSTGVATWVSCNTDQPAGDQDLLGDGAQTLGAEQTWNLSGLRAGTYLLTVYARAACTSGPTLVTVHNNGHGDGQAAVCLQRPMETESTWGRSFVVRGSQGTLGISLRPSSPESEVRLSGLQLQLLGTGRAAMLSLGSQRVAFRTGGDAPLSAPSCDRLQSRDRQRILLRGGPVGTNFNVLQPVRAAIQTPLMRTGWHPAAGPAHAALQWAGVEFWWQLVGREGALGATRWLRS